MKNKINIAELLKDCPSGMELNCLMYEDVYFDYVDTLNIIHCYIQHKAHKTYLMFNQHGTPNSDIKSKCVIFPKGKTTWEGFVPPCKFKEGDVVVSRFGDIHLLRTGDSSYCAYRMYWTGATKFDNTITTSVEVARLATEEEKAKLFDAIKAEGYKWNANTNTLEKLPETKFKVGDRIKNKNVNLYHTVNDILGGSYIVDDNLVLDMKMEHLYELAPDIKPKFKIGDRIKKDKDLISGVITNISDDGSYKVEYQGSGVSYVYPACQDDWELVPDIKPKFKVGDRIRSIISNSGYIYNVIEVKESLYVVSKNNEYDNKLIDFKIQDCWELVPNKFDITTLVPFESKVLVRNGDRDHWRPAIFGGYVKNKDNEIEYYYALGGTCWRNCIPYEGNEHLSTTTDDCDIYYKN